jgi:predicted Ser/Thr protein kinase
MRPDPSSSSHERTPPPVKPENDTVAATPPIGTFATLPQQAEPAPGRLPDKLPAPFGRYELLKQLGQGGMGAVYLARDTQLDRLVALKVPFFTASDGPHVLERFLREARAAATLHHANVCPVFDVGQIDGIHYLTMAYIEGRSLAEVLRGDKKPATPREAAALVRKLALALDQAHRKNVIHRDLKPGNIMLAKGGEPIIMDFGLAHRGESGDVRLTQQGTVIGTPAYMAPEQARGAIDQMGPSCDIYSLGVILYELLTGRLPFSGDTFTLLAQLMVDDPPPPSSHRPDSDDRIEAICLKAIAKKPADRHASMAEFAAALTDYLKSTDQTLPPGAPPPSAELPFTETSLEAPSASPRAKSRWSLVAALAGVGLLLLCGASVLVYVVVSRTRGVAEHGPDTAAVVTAGKGEPVEAKEDEPVPYAWPADALREGKVPAPDFSRVRAVFQDEFDDSTSGFPRGQAPRGGFRGYRNGKYFIDIPGRGYSFWAVPLDRTKPAPQLGDFACRLIGRARGEKTRWGFAIITREASGETHRLTTWISDTGLLYVTEYIGPGVGTNKTLREPVSHPAIKSGEDVFNTLLVVLRGRQLEIYVNGVAVCDPLFLERAISSPRLALEGRGGTQNGGTAEFDSITIWPADSLPSLTARGATPRR